MARPHYVKAQKHFFTAAMIAAFFYIIYMVTVDVPTYVIGWLEANVEGKTYATVLQGFKEVATEWRYTRMHEDWQYEFTWMTLYFSLAVWMSMYIVNAPFLDRNLKNRIK